MFWVIKTIFIGLLTSTLSASNHTRCMLLSNQKCMTQTTLIYLLPNEYSPEFLYYPFAVKLNRCVGNFNTLNDWSYKVCIPNKIEDLNLTMFNMITGINQLKTLAKHIWCKCKCGLNGKKLMIWKSIRKYIIMPGENISQKFRLKNIDETRNHLPEEIKKNELMSKKHKKVCTTLSCIKTFLI